ncbi:hypothetical protein L798_14794 [Zootermopsis nevadensis]|uniref:Uncharacterized protein n=1 Tax=Zootermopsis nevadensis TaxID=136037 RepID=A0A067RGN1_ZOONE|nr:hypothetical protein L798_14794 [Zootermopsis nevadensis]
MSQEDIVEQCQVLPSFVPDRQFCIAVMKVCVLIFMVGAVAATQVPAPATTKITFFEAPEPTANEAIGINGIMTQPVVALVKERSGIVAYVLEKGMTSLVTDLSPVILRLNEILRENDKTALIFNPVTLAADTNPNLQQVRELPIVKVVAPENTRVSSVARISLSTLPIVMLFEREDFASRKYQSLVSYGEVDLATFAPTIV